MQRDGPAPEFTPGQWFAQPAILCALLAAATFIVFWPTAGYDYINLDDPVFVSSNAHVLQGLTWEGVGWAFRFDHGDYWHPLTWLSLMLDVTLFGRGAGGLHMTNVLLHAANAVLLFWLLWCWTGALWRSAFVAALFALHPLRVESVAWITERKDVLSTLFMLLSLWAYARSAKCEVRGANARRTSHFALPPGAFDARRSTLDYAMALLFFAFGLMSKAMIVTLPFVMLLLDYWPLGRVPGARHQAPGTHPQSVQPSTLNQQRSTLLRLVTEKLPFFALSVCSSVVTLGWKQKIEAAATAADLSVLLRIENAIVAYGRYLGKLFWPADLAVYYPHPGRWNPAEVICAAAVVGGLSAGALWWSRRRPYFLVGWFWFLGTLIPVIGLTRGWLQFMADRFTYVPLIGLFIIAAWGAGDVFHRLRFSRTGQVAFVWFCGCVIAGCALQTTRQLRHWRDSGTLFRHAVAVTRNNDVGCYNLACWLEARGQADEAMAYYRKAIEANPRYANARNNLGLLLAGKGAMDAAIQEYAEALRIAPHYAETWSNLGNALLAKGRLADAMEHYRRALEINPGMAQVHHNLGIALGAAGRTDEAISEYSEALRLAPGRAETHNNIGYAMQTKGRMEDALDHYRKAIGINPDYVEALNNLGMALGLQGRLDEAIGYFARAQRVDPRSARTWCNLGSAYSRKGDPDNAILNYRRAIELDSNHVEAFNGLGVVLGQRGDLDAAIACFKDALRISPGNVPARNNLGNALEGKGLLDDAVREYESALRVGPGNPDTHYNLGRALARVGRRDEAMAHLNDALRIRPDFPEARRQLRALGVAVPGD